MIHDGEIIQRLKIIILTYPPFGHCGDIRMDRVVDCIYQKTSQAQWAFMY